MNLPQVYMSSQNQYNIVKLNKIKLKIKNKKQKKIKIEV